MMDLKGIVFLLIVLVNVVCSTLIASTQEDPDSYNQLSAGSRLSIKQIEQRLRQDIDQEMEDLREYELELKNKYIKMQNKKRQLEIRKRQPVQCLVNIVSCWRRK